MDGTGKNDEKGICLFKKKGKVKALDEELHSEFCAFPPSLDFDYVPSDHFSTNS